MSHSQWVWMGLAALVASVALQGCGGGSSPTLVPTPAPFVPLPTPSPTPAPTPTSPPLPHFSEFHASDVVLGDGFNFGGHTYRAFNYLDACTANQSAPPCVASKSEVSIQPYTAKLSEWTDVRQNALADFAVDGFSGETSYADFIEASDQNLHFVLGLGVTTSRKIISNFSELRLLDIAKAQLLKNPADFTQLRGPFVVSELVFGAKFLCRYTLRGPKKEDRAYLEKLFAPITADVFFNRTMSDDFIKKIDEANNRLIWPNFQCQLAGGPRMSIPVLPPPFDLGQILHTWYSPIFANVSLYDTALLRVAVQRVADVQDVKDILLNKTDSEKAPLVEVQRITSNTTAQMSADVAEASFAKHSADVAGSIGDEYHCIEVNQTLREALHQLADEANSYFVRLQLWNSTDVGVIQQQISSGNHSWLQGNGLHQRYNDLMKNCNSAWSVYV